MKLYLVAKQHYHKASANIFDYIHSGSALHRIWVHVLLTLAYEIKSNERHISVVKMNSIQLATKQMFTINIRTLVP